uniref:Uncharacterized protein n=1 Tax=Arundo donax TaxID=35708 RepID=A0A0A8ZRQ8_ARUDO
MILVLRCIIPIKSGLWRHYAFKTKWSFQSTSNKIHIGVKSSKTSQ